MKYLMVLSLLLLQACNDSSNDELEWRVSVERRLDKLSEASEAQANLLVNFNERLMALRGDQTLDEAERGSLELKLNSVNQEAMERDSGQNEHIAFLLDTADSQQKQLQSLRKLVENLSR